MKNIYLVILSLTLTSVSHADLKPYGTLRFDASKDSSGHLVDNTKTATGIGDESVAVVGPDKSTYSMNVRSSTFGVTGESKGSKFNLDGRVEVDFFGEASSSNAVVAEPALTYGYIHAVCQTTDMNLTAGQTDDIVSPLKPSTLNHNQNHYAGNVGHTRPQFILSRDFMSHLNVAAALGHAFSGREETGTDLSTHLEIDTKDRFDFNVALGWGYLRGVDRTTTTIHNNHRFELPMRMNSFNLKASLKGFTVKGEYYRGQGLDDYKGIGGNITNVDRGETHYHALAERGYWLDGSYEWTKFMFNAGYSKAKADRTSLETHLSQPAILASNQVAWTGVKWNAYKDFNVGFEYSRLTSLWVDTGNDDRTKTETANKDERYQLMFSYNI